MHAHPLDEVGLGVDEGDGDVLGAQSPGEAAGFPDAGEHVTATERRAALAEREAVDRYLVAFMAERVGACFAARISGVTRFGVFVTLTDTGASGLLPISGLPDDAWALDELAQSLRARRSGRSLTLAQRVEVRLTEASSVTGGLLFQLSADDPAQDTGTAPSACCASKPRDSVCCGGDPESAR